MKVVLLDNKVRSFCSFRNEYRTQLFLNCTILFTSVYRIFYTIFSFYILHMYVVSNLDQFTKQWNGKQVKFDKCLQKLNLKKWFTNLQALKIFQNLLLFFSILFQKCFASLNIIVHLVLGQYH